MCVHPKGTYAHLTENSQDFIFLLLSKNFAVCLLGAHTKKLSQWELDTLCMFIISWSQPYTWSVQKVIPSLIKRCKGIYRLFLSFHMHFLSRYVLPTMLEFAFRRSTDLVTITFENFVLLCRHKFAKFSKKIDDVFCAYPLVVF